MIDMLLGGFFWLFAVGAMAAAMIFIVSKAVLRMPSKAARFVVLFALWVPFGFAYNYSKVLVHRYYKMSWTEALICALLAATLGMFCLPRPNNSNT
jgi:hypothetical protein